jgi:micrococcal nuclease
MFFSILRAVRSLRAVALLGIALAGYLGCGSSVHRPGQPSEVVRHAQLVRVIDGDTISVDLGGRTRRVRLLGVDAPEKSTTRYGRPDCGGAQASRSLGLLLGKPGRRLTLIADAYAPDSDRYGRLLRYVKLTGPGRRTVQENLLEQGWAETYFLGQRLLRRASFSHAAELGRRARAGVYERCDGNFHDARRNVSCRRSD